MSVPLTMTFGSCSRLPRYWDWSELQEISRGTVLVTLFLQPGVLSDVLRLRPAYPPKEEQKIFCSLRFFPLYRQKELETGSYCTYLRLPAYSLERREVRCDIKYQAAIILFYAGPVFTSTAHAQIRIHRDRCVTSGQIARKITRKITLSRPLHLYPKLVPIRAHNSNNRTRPPTSCKSIPSFPRWQARSGGNI